MIGIRLGSFLFLGSPDSSFLFSYQAAAAPGYFARQIVFANDDLSPAIAAAKPNGLAKIVVAVLPLDHEHPRALSRHVHDFVRWHDKPPCL